MTQADFYIPPQSFAAITHLENRLQTICSIAEIGDYYYEFDTQRSYFAEYLFEFYELEKNFNTAEVLNAGFYSDVDQSKLLKMMEAVRLHGISSDGEFMITLPDGRIKWHHSFLKPIVDVDGTITGVYGCLQNITTKKNAEISADRKRKFYDSILEKLPAQVAAFDKNLRYLFVNEGAIKDTEKRNLIIGKTNREYFSATGRDPNTGDDRDKKMRECLSLKKPVVFEERMTTGAKDQIFLRIFKPVFTDEGEIDYCLGYGIDITELKQIQNINNQQKIAIDNSMDGIALLDENGYYTYTNPSHAILFGHSDPEELLGKSWRAIYIEEEVNRIENAIFPELKKKGSWSGEAIGLKKGGNSIYLEISLTSLSDGGILCICRDVTCRKEQELELKRLAIVAQRTNSMVMITDASRKIVWVNDSFISTFKYRLEEIKGVDPSHILQGPETSEITKADISHALKTGLRYSGEILNYTKTNEKIWIYIDITPIYDNKGELTNFVAVEHDITLNKKAEEKLKESIEKERQLNRFKSEFVHTASHQFRTPLSSIKSSLDILELKSDRETFEKFTQTFKKHKEIISRETERMTEFMDNILDLGRLDQGRIDYKPERTNLKEFVMGFLKAYSKQNKLNKVTFEFNAPEIEMVIDKVLLKNVFHNILSNAFKYSEGSTAPEFIVDVKGRYLTISIRDFGIGIPLSEQKYLFHSFFRASNAHSHSGTGLGLLIAKRMMEVMGGTIEIVSEIGKGSTVFLKFPVNK